MASSHYKDYTNHTNNLLRFSINSCLDENELQIKLSISHTALRI